VCVYLSNEWLIMFGSSLGVVETDFSSTNSSLKVRESEIFE